LESEPVVPVRSVCGVGFLAALRAFFLAVAMRRRRGPDAAGPDRGVLGDRFMFFVPGLGAASPGGAATSDVPAESGEQGHTAAAMALYGGIILLARRRGMGWPVWLLAAIPLAVGASRLYRGMHHPSDVIAAMVLGTLALVLMHRTVLAEPLAGTAAEAGSATRPRAPIRPISEA
jgi:PAP2 superfamily